eukprot:GFYU01035991.1.p1 GENE.GFYU01035991.1~~GFYU01035991.1.p1  ORF type:complete len:478 (-),score=110.11 GFYU01035991.1:504-1937(-)
MGMSYLVSYSVLNLACFSMRVASAPNWRPTFRYYKWYTAFIGFVLCVVIMITLDPVRAFVCILLFVAMFVYIQWSSPPNQWGGVSQAIIFHQVRKYLLRLPRKQHVKNWRLQLMLLAKSPESNANHIHFCNHICRNKGSMYLIGNIVQTEDFMDHTEILRIKNAVQLLREYISDNEIDALEKVIPSTSVRHGIQALVASSGLGSMTPNTIALGFPNFRRDKASTKARGGVALNIAEFVSSLRDIIMLEKSAIVLRGFDEQHRVGLDSPDAEKMNIDLWVRALDEESILSIQLGIQFAYLLKRSRDWWKYNTIIRVISCVYSEESSDSQSLCDEMKAHLEEIVTAVRVPAEVVVFQLPRHLELGKPEDVYKSPEISANPLTRVGNNETRMKSNSVDNASDKRRVWAKNSRPGDYYSTVNTVIKENSHNTVVTVLPIAAPPLDTLDFAAYFEALDVSSEGLPPTVMIHNPGQEMITGKL